ncbi:hypothetical protein ACFY4B_27195 [Kitasatospora sp. NPDC001261]|uniref:hypothetical protein n=1 Tax=Kitasatospora sp. NPDC001261 TaxID=3364012 RepID=UPI0036B9C739
MRLLNLFRRQPDPPVSPERQALEERARTLRWNTYYVSGETKETRELAELERRLRELGPSEAAAS